jgi:hypothetical protein
VSCWTIWFARRKTIHEEIFKNPLATMAVVNGLIEKLQIIKVLELSEKNHHQPKQTNQWYHAPECGQNEINVDATVAREGVNGAVGAICRDDHMKFVAASVKSDSTYN